MKYLIIYKRKYSSIGHAVEEFDTPTAMLNAILAGDYEGKDIILARRMSLAVTDAVEVPIEEPRKAFDEDDSPAVVVEQSGAAEPSSEAAGVGA